MKHFNTTVEPTKNENIVKFVINSIISQAKSYEFTNIDTAKPSPLAQELFSLPFVKTIYLSQNFIAIEKFTSENTPINWKDVQDDVANSITDYLNSGKPVITDTSEGNKIPVTIYAENTPNPEVMKFVANKKLATRIYEFKSSQETNHAPLAESLFDFPFVKEVFINSNYVSITKQSNFEWHDFVNELRGFIKSYIEDGNKIFEDEILERETSASSVPKKQGELTAIDKEIISILDEYVRPAVESDGGNIAFESYDEDTKTVKVILQGACSGCPSSTVTLKNGIEAMLREILKGKVMTVEAING